MSTIRQVAERLQAVLGARADELARQTGFVRRVRKFSGASWLSMLVLTLLKQPRAGTAEFRQTAAQLGVCVTAEAIDKRFTAALGEFLWRSLAEALGTLLAAEPSSAPLLRKFTAVRLGDASTLTLPECLANRRPGLRGAAVKLQVVWDLLRGGLQVVCFVVALVRIAG